MDNKIKHQIDIERNKGALVSSGAGIQQDWQALAEHLAGHGLTLDLKIAPEQFASGFGNLNYLIKVDEQLAVLRRPPMGPIPPGANDMARENFILSRLPNAYPLAPRALHFCESPDVLGAHFFIMEYRPGTIIGGEIPQPILDSWSGHESIGEHLGEQLISSLASLHNLNPSAIGLDKLGKPEGFVDRTLKGWSKRAELAWKNQIPQSLLPVIQWLGENKPERVASSFIHNDFKLDNMILDPVSLEPLAVIDWDMGTMGDPLYDLAVLLGYWTEAGDPECMHQMNQMPTAQHGFVGRSEAAKRYAELTGASLDNFQFYRALASLRNAAVFRQLYNRFNEGGTKDKRYEKFNMLADQLADFALAVVNNSYA